MKYPKLRELREAIKALIKGPYTSRFPYEPHRPYESFRGRPDFHETDCIGCSACFEVCPARAIDMQDVKDKRILTVHWDMCIFCGQCQANCPTEKGITLTREFDLATTGKRQDLMQSIEKKLVLCVYCNDIIAPEDQILWVAHKIGPLLFSNTSLMLFYLKSQNLSALREKPSEELQGLRSDRFQLLCSRCRREAVIKS